MVRSRLQVRGLTLLVALATVGCGSSPLGSPAISASPVANGIDIPTGALPPDTQCYVDHGFRVVGTLPQGPGEPPGYKLESGLSNEEAARVTEKCQKLQPELPPKTPEQVRQIYVRWVDERTCLVELGYTPTEPPTFETFLNDYLHGASGPWMPIDGVDTGAWSDADYQAAKSRCTLEMFAR